MDTIHLEAAGVGRRVANRWLLDNVSLSIRGGDEVALVGPTGSGKTLLLRSLALLDPIDAGEVRWSGRAIPGDETPAFRQRVLYLGQRPALVEGTVEDNLLLPYSLRAHREKRFDRERILSFLNALGRDTSFLSKEQRDLSGGESQIAALLRAIQLDPNVLLLDEPTAALDGESAKAVERLTRGWRQESPENRATVWITHDDNQSSRVANRIVRMRDGKLE